MEDGRNICTVIFGLCMCVVDSALIAWSQYCQRSCEESLSNFRYFVKLSPWYMCLSRRFQHPSNIPFHSSSQDWSDCTDDFTHLHYPVKTYSILAKHWFPSLCRCIAGLALKPPGSRGGLALRLFSWSIDSWSDLLNIWISSQVIFSAKKNLLLFSTLEVDKDIIYYKYI